MTKSAISMPAHQGPGRECERLVAVQALRLVVAVLVLANHAEIYAFHLGRFLGQPVAERLYLLNGGFGVDLFFAISGFVMVISTERLPTTGARRTFLRRRVVRVAPLYWLATLFTAAWLATIDQVRPTREILLSLLFVPYASAENRRVAPVLDVGWTLNYEMAFYLLFAAALGGTARSTAMRAAALILALVGVGMATTLPLPAWAWARPILLEFVSGIAVALAWRQGVQLQRWLRITMMAIALALLARSAPTGEAASLARVASAGIAGALVLAAAVLGPLPLPRPRTWQTGGDISYALYLCHMPLMMVAQFIWRHFHWPYGPVHAVAFALGCMATSLGVAIVIHFAIEMPMTDWLNHKLANRLNAPDQQPAGTPAG